MTLQTLIKFKSVSFPLLAVNNRLMARNWRAILICAFLILFKSFSNIKGNFILFIVFLKSQFFQRIEQKLFRQYFVFLLQRLYQILQFRYSMFVFVVEFCLQIARNFVKILHCDRLEVLYLAFYFFFQKIKKYSQLVCLILHLIEYFKTNHLFFWSLFLFYLWIFILFVQNRLFLSWRLLFCIVCMLYWLYFSCEIILWGSIIICGFNNTNATHFALKEELKLGKKIRFLSQFSCNLINTVDFSFNCIIHC